MPILYAVKPKTNLLCDYGAGGFRPPEMVKRRPAVVVTGDLPGRRKLHTVVPLSGTPSDSRNRYHCRIVFDTPLPDPFPQTIWWVKADMIATVAFDRLDLFRTARDQYGKRKYLSNLRVSDEQFAAIHESIRHALLIDLDKQELATHIARGRSGGDSPNLRTPGDGGDYADGDNELGIV